MADVPHYCSACGEIHGGHSGETEAIKIAKIEADRDIEVARLARAEARQEIEAGVEETKIEAAAAVDAAVVESQVIEELATPEPAAIIAPQGDPAPVTEVPEAVSEPESPPESEPVSSGSKGGGWWAGYR